MGYDLHLLLLFHCFTLGPTSSLLYALIMFFICSTSLVAFSTASCFPHVREAAAAAVAVVSPPATTGSPPPHLLFCSPHTSRRVIQGVSQDVGRTLVLRRLSSSSPVTLGGGGGGGGGEEVAGGGDGWYGGPGRGEGEIERERGGT